MPVGNNYRSGNKYNQLLVEALNKGPHGLAFIPGREKDLIFHDAEGSRTKDPYEIKFSRYTNLKIETLQFKPFTENKIEDYHLVPGSLMNFYREVDSETPLRFLFLSPTRHDKHQAEVMFLRIPTSVMQLLVEDATVIAEQVDTLLASLKIEARKIFATTNQLNDTVWAGVSKKVPMQRRRLYYKHYENIHLNVRDAVRHFDLQLIPIASMKMDIVKNEFNNKEQIEPYFETILYENNNVILD